MAVARNDNRLTDQINRDDVQFCRHLAIVLRVQIIVCGARRRAIAHALREQRYGFARDQVRNLFGAAAGVLTIHQHERQSAVRSLDHLQRIAGFVDGVLWNFGGSNFKFHSWGKA